MVRLAPKIEVIRALFARSGNRCAFPGCDHPLVNQKNQFISQVCHIESAKPGGERYNPHSTDEERRGYDNLVLLCYAHHIETNDVSAFPAERMREIKAKHEENSSYSTFTANDTLVVQIAREMENYWDQIDRLNRIEHIFHGTGLEMKVDSKATFREVIESTYRCTEHLESILQVFTESDDGLQQELISFASEISPELCSAFQDSAKASTFVNRNWEYHYIGGPNFLLRLRIDLTQLEVIYLSTYIQLAPEDLEAKEHFEKAKQKLREYAKTAMHVD